MKTAQPLLLACITASFIFLFRHEELNAAEAEYKLAVVTSHDDALYQAGEPIVFEVKLTKNDKPVSDAEVEYVVDDFIVDHPPVSNFPKGKLRLGEQSIIEATRDEPGFLRCQVTFRPPSGDPMTTSIGAGVEPKRIQPGLPIPEDFQKYWKEQKAELAKVPMTSVLTEVPQKHPSIDCYDLQIPCLGGAPVSGYFAKPRGAKAGTLPAVLWVHAAGVRGSNLGTASRGALANMISLDINAHGLPNGRPAKFYQKQNAGRLKGYRREGHDDREKIYFRGMFLRLIRAMDFLTSQPEWDRKTLVVYGFSQGGGQAIVAGGLDERVTLVVAGVPAICDHAGRAAGQINGWPKLVPIREDGTPDPVSLEVSRYFDAANFAAQSKADVVMCVGFVDTTCPASSCYAAFNQFSGEKTIFNYPTMGHRPPNPVRRRMHAQMLKYVESHRLSDSPEKPAKRPSETAAAR